MLDGHTVFCVGARSVDVLLCVGARSVELSTDEYHVHEVATVLKRFLRTLDDPLLTNSLYQHWLNAARNIDHFTSSSHRRLLSSLCTVSALCQRQ